MTLPTGTVTFLFTDIEGSTRLWEAHPEEMRVALTRHDALMRGVIETRGGYVFKTIGDAFCAAFHTAPDAVEAVLEAQLALGQESWPAPIAIKVRMALHTGAVESRDNDYFGQPLNRVARLLAVGHGGQTLVSLAAQELVRDALPPGCSLKFMGEHQLKDLGKPESIAQLNHPDLPREFLPLRSLDNVALPNNLPRQTTSFIGREKELSELRKLLEKTPLLTLTGSGGAGKTRLALQVGADLLDRFADGAWLVELAPLADPGMVPQTVADLFGLKEEVGRPITLTLTEYLKSKRALLLLDNCEHLLDACSQLAGAILRQCPQVTILASSREGLGIAGETTYRVPSLSLPDLKQAQSPESLSNFDAVRLFVERATQVQTVFTVTEGNASALASVCSRLDGIPLAIELAAARIRSMSVEEVNARLDQRFRLLTGGSRTALPRQQTLRSLIDWSYNLLNDAEKALLCRLSVFTGGWTLESAEVVCSGDLVEDWEVLNLLTSLCDKSLAIAEEQAGVTRYRLLETVRQYARDRLLESGVGETYRSKHQDCFLALAEVAEPEFKGANQGLWLNRLEAEHENLRTGLDWSLGQEGAEKALRFCAALMRYWELRGYLSEGREWCARALNAPGGQEHNMARVRALTTACALAFRLSDYTAAQSYAHESLVISREVGDRGGIADSLGDLGALALRQGDPVSARTYMEESLAIFREMGNPDRIARVLNNLGSVAFDQGDYTSAHALYEEGLILRREMGDRGGVAMALVNLGTSARQKGDYTSARVFYEESLTIYRELGSPTFIASTVNYLGNVAFHQGDYMAARALYKEGLILRRELGNQGGVATSLESFARLATRSGKTEQSARLWGAAAALREKVGMPVPPVERDEYEKVLGQLRHMAGEKAFEAAWQEGRAMTIEQAVELATKVTTID